jgi:hypothetical protein
MDTGNASRKRRLRRLEEALAIAEVPCTCCAPVECIQVGDVEQVWYVGCRRHNRRRVCVRVLRGLSIRDL